MKSFITYLLSAICALAVIIVLIFTAMQLVIFDENRFHESYEENDLYEFIGVEKDTLHEITHEMMGYLKGTRDDLIMHAEIRGEYQQVFEEREIAHMVDVKALFMGGFMIRNIAAVTAAVLLGVLFGLRRKDAIKPLCKSYLWVMGAFIAIAAILGIYMVIDFNALFIKFHHVFFTNDLWLLDIDTDVLIQMLPESFFNSLALSIVYYLAAFILIPSIAAASYLIWRRKKDA